LIAYAAAHELVRGDVGHDGGLAGGVRRVAGRPFQVPGRRHRVTARGAGLHHLQLSARPRTRRPDRVPRPPVGRPDGLEEVEDVLGAGRRPQREQVVVLVGERAAATDRHQPRVRDLGEDHGQILPAGPEPANSPVTRCPSAQL
jgi:hypothetical protein